MTYTKEVLQPRNSPKVTELLCRSFVKKNEGIIEQKKNYRFIAASKIISGEYSSIVTASLNCINKYEELDSKNGSPAGYLCNKYLNKLNSFLGRVAQYKTPNTKIDADAELGLVCRGFENVNSSGVKLTAFDLINAKSFDSENPEHSDEFSDYIIAGIEKEAANSKTRELSIKSFFGWNDKSATYTSLARVSRTLVIAGLLSQGLTPAITNSYMLATPRLLD